MRRVTEKLTIAECKRRALEYMQNKPMYFFRPSEVAEFGIWPGSTFRAQGAGLAGARILKLMIDDGLVKWDQEDRIGMGYCGYRLTAAGRAATVVE